MDENNQFYILEVNPNPFINSRAMTNGLEAIGRTHEDFIIALVEAALRRKGQSAYTQLLAPAKAALKAEVTAVDNEPQN